MSKKETPSLQRATMVKLFFAVALLLLMIVLLLHACGPDAVDGEQGGGIVWDSNAEEGGLVAKSKEEILAELNAKVEEGMINISMNTSPVFKTGTDKGNLLIVNSNKNNYPQVVYILLQETGEEIYRSGGIPVGSKIEYAALNKDLEPGVYDCLACFNNVDPETGTMLGEARAEIKITVQG